MCQYKTNAMDVLVSGAIVVRFNVRVKVRVPNIAMQVHICVRRNLT